MATPSLSGIQGKIVSLFYLSIYRNAKTKTLAQLAYCLSFRGRNSTWPCLGIDEYQKGCGMGTISIFETKMLREGRWLLGMQM
jgi:hypothetical protein